MYRKEAKEEYLLALKQGQKVEKQLLAADQDPYPTVLDNILETIHMDQVVDVGLVEIPSERIVGVKSAGRTTAFTKGFLPLLPETTEFGYKWISLCADHLSTGIRDPIICYEYLGNFYVQEGNKRVSVLRHFGAPRIWAQVRRVMPPRSSEEPRIRAYYEFLEFYKTTGLYQIQFRRPGEYAQLLAHLGKQPEESWTDRERRTFSAYYHYFCEALSSLGDEFAALVPEDALLLWLKVYSFRDLGEMSTSQLKKAVAGLKKDLLSVSQEEPVQVSTEPAAAADKAPGLLSRILAGIPDHVHVAFIYPMDAAISTWVAGHEQGRKYLQEKLGEQVVVKTYFMANSPEETIERIHQAVADGADVIFTTTPQMSRSTLRMAIRYPKVRFLNCSVDAPYSSIRTYYGRIFEAKFITGAIAGAMADDDHIGYIGSSPIFGVPASINAFALGAQMTNPRAKILLRWSCQKGAHQAEFFDRGIRVVSNRDVPVQDQRLLNFCNYGTYCLDDQDKLTPLASPCWVWGKFYEQVVRSILSGNWSKDKVGPQAVNYWWGMDSGVIDIELSDQLPAGVAHLANTLRETLRNGTLDPFRRPITDQNGVLRNDGSRSFTAEELLHMDWLCENVEGSIPEYDQIEAYAQPIVRELGVHRDQVPTVTEGSL